jgi:hypothetical protein
LRYAFLLIAITSLLVLISICGYCVWKVQPVVPLGGWFLVVVLVMVIVMVQCVIQDYTPPL